jgi:hypothetical protein
MRLFLDTARQYSEAGKDKINSLYGPVKALPRLIGSAKRKIIS